MQEILRDLKAFFWLRDCLITSPEVTKPQSFFLRVFETSCLCGQKSGIIKQSHKVFLLPSRVHARPSAQ